MGESTLLWTLAEQGYEVFDCGDSLPRFFDRLAQGKVDAIVVSESETEPRQVLAVAHSLSVAPAILFEGENAALHRDAFDLVVPHHTPPADWLGRVREAIGRSHIQIATSASNIERANLRQQTSSALVNESVGRIEYQKSRKVAPDASALKLGTLLIVDDYEAWRRTLTSIFQLRAEAKTIDEAVNGFEALRKAEDMKPDLLLLDIGLPGLNGIEVAKRLRETVPTTKIVLLSMYRQSELVAEALATGAHAYVLKTDVERELWTAIEAVLDGRKYVSTGLGEVMMS